jgi:hypothetical protein
VDHNGPLRRTTTRHPTRCDLAQRRLLLRDGPNLRDSSAVAITTGRNDWDQGLDVVVEGNARRVTDRSTLEQLANEWAKKWDGRWHYHVDPDGFRHAGGEHGPVHVYEVQPTKILAFGKQPFTHTRHTPS